METDTMNVVMCYFCQNPILATLCEPVEMSRKLDDGTVEKKTVLRCQDCEDEQRAEVRAKRKKVLQ